MMRKIGILFSIIFVGISIAGVCMDGPGMVDPPLAKEGDGKKQTTSSPKECLRFSMQELCTVAAVFPPQTDEHEKKTVEDFARAKACLVKASDDHQKLSTYQIVRDLAVSGHIPSVLVLGDICNRRKEDIDALKWYVHAFQLQWFRTGEWEGTAQDKLTLLWTKKYKKPAAKQITYFKSHFQRVPLDQSPKQTLLQFFSVISGSYVKYGTAIEPFCQIDEIAQKVQWLTGVRDRHCKNHVCLLLGDSLLENGDHKEALKYFQQCNTSFSLYCIGRVFDGKHLGDFEKAASFFERSGAPVASHDLARLYFDAHIGAVEGVPNYKRAAELCEQSIARHEQFTFRSTYDLLAFLHLKGFYGAVMRGKPNYKRAIDLYFLSQTEESFDNLGLLWSRGNHDPKHGKPDYVTAAKYFEKAGVRGANNLGCLYYRGQYGLLPGKKRDYVKAAQCFEESNSSNSFHSLGNLYYYGQYGSVGGTPNYAKSIEYYRKSDVPEARLYLGMIHLNDPHLCHALYNQHQNLSVAWREFESCPLLFAKAYQLYMIKEYRELLGEFLSQDELDMAQKSIVALIEAQLKTFKAKSRDREFYNGMLAYWGGNYDDAYMYLSNATFRDVWGAHFFMQKAQYHKRRIELENAPILGSDVEEEEEDDSLEFLEIAVAPAPIKSPPLPAAVAKKKPMEVAPVVPLKIEAAVHKIYMAAAQEVIQEVTQERLQQYKPEIKKRTALERLKAQLARINNISLLSFEEGIDSDRNETEEEQKPLKIKFLSPAVERTFESLKGDKKMTELLEDIALTPYALEGAGQPEILKGKFLKKYRGCYSRRINDKDRLVYKVTGRNEIFIFSCEGHYDD
jgi:toxin YoeB